MMKLFTCNQYYFNLFHIQLPLSRYWIYETRACAHVYMYVYMYVCTSQGLKQTYIPVSPTLNVKREPNEDAYQIEDTNKLTSLDFHLFHPVVYTTILK
jgi:hypothetical protein